MKLTKQIIEDILSGKNNKSYYYINGKKFVAYDVDVTESYKYDEVKDFRKKIRNAGVKQDSYSDEMLTKYFLQDYLENLQKIN